VPAYTGLLDTYPGAAAAYSLRLLDSDYSGSAIRVRRASDNAEQDIGFDANGDLDTTALDTFCSGTDGFCKVWYDQANSNDLTQTNTGDQAKITASSGGQITVNNGTADTSMHLFFGSFIGGSQTELSVDGTNVTAATSISSLPLTDEIDVSMIDSSGSKILKTNQYMAALIVWNSDQSTNRAGIETNINDYYNIYTP
jgi:hypothetical protein